MELSDLTIKLIFLFIPGIISFLIVSHLTVHSPWTPFYFVAYSMMLGFANYVILSGAMFLLSIIWPGVEHIEFWDILLSLGTSASESSVEKIYFREVFFASSIAIITGLLFALIINKKILFQISRYLRISQKMDDDDVWQTFLEIKDIDYIYLRLPEENLVYAGRVKYFSFPHTPRELVMVNVDVYLDNDQKNTNEVTSHLYSMNSIYLSLEGRKFTLEDPSNYISQNGGNNE